MNTKTSKSAPKELSETELDTVAGGLSKGGIVKESLTKSSGIRIGNAAGVRIGNEAGIRVGSKIRSSSGIRIADKVSGIRK